MLLVMEWGGGVGILLSKHNEKVVVMQCFPSATVWHCSSPYVRHAATLRMALLCQDVLRAGQQELEQKCWHGDFALHAIGCGRKEHTSQIQSVVKCLSPLWLCSCAVSCVC